MVESTSGPGDARQQSQSSCMEDPESTFRIHYKTIIFGLSVSFLPKPTPSSQAPLHTTTGNHCPPSNVQMQTACLAGPGSALECCHLMMHLPQRPSSYITTCTCLSAPALFANHRQYQITRLKTSPEGHPIPWEPMKAHRARNTNTVNPRSPSSP